jgi:hypothetical protein
MQMCPHPKAQRYEAAAHTSKSEYLGLFEPQVTIILNLWHFGWISKPAQTNKRKTSILRSHTLPLLCLNILLSNTKFEHIPHFNVKKALLITRPPKTTPRISTTSAAATSALPIFHTSSVCCTLTHARIRMQEPNGSVPITSTPTGKDQMRIIPTDPDQITLPS